MHQTVSGIDTKIKSATILGTWLTIVTRTDGQPLSKNGFCNNFRDHRERLLKQGLVKPGLAMHGLRYTAATYLATLGRD